MLNDINNSNVSMKFVWHVKNQLTQINLNDYKIWISKYIKVSNQSQF